jgi:hypothetical protein
MDALSQVKCMEDVVKNLGNLPQFSTRNIKFVGFSSRKCGNFIRFSTRTKENLSGKFTRKPLGFSSRLLWIRFKTGKMYGGSWWKTQ